MNDWVSGTQAMFIFSLCSAMEIVIVMVIVKALS